MEMKAEYEQWIDHFVADDGACLCEEYSYAMVKVFPELRQVGGVVVFADGEWEPHWWCVTADGEVVDPTAAQFEGEDDDDPDLWPKPWTYKRDRETEIYAQAIEPLENFFILRSEELDKDNSARQTL